MRMAMAWWVMAAAATLHGQQAIKPAAELPATQPWNLAELSKAPRFEWVDEKAPVRSLKYEGEIYRGKPTWVFAFYASPATLSGAAGDVKQRGAFPGVVLIHGGGGTAFPEWCEMWAKRGYAAIAMDLAGHEPCAPEESVRRDKNPRKRMADGGPDQGSDEKFQSISRDVTEQWPYHAVANVIRAHSLLQSFAEVDANRTAVTGISWGGYLTCVVSGVDSRFKAAAPVYGCGFLYENSSWLGEFAKMSPADKDRWIERYDPSRYLPACKAAIFFVNGTNDFHYRIAQWNKSAELPRGERNLRMTVKMGHSHPAGWEPQEIGLFFDSYLTGGTPLASIGPVRVADGETKAALRAIVPVVKAELHWTEDDLSIENRDRQWHTKPIEVTRTSVRTDLPPREAQIWFLTATDERGATVSSEIHFKE